MALVYAVDMLDAAFAAVNKAAADPTSFANFGNIAFNRVTAFREDYAQLNLDCVERIINPSRNLSGNDWIATLA